MALDTPGCEVCSALAASVRLRLRRTASWTKRNWCRFISIFRLMIGIHYACLQLRRSRGLQSSGQRDLRHQVQSAAGLRPPAAAARTGTPGCAARSCATSSGRSSRACLPTPRNMRHDRDWRGAGVHQLALARCGQVGRAQLQVGAAHQRIGRRGCRMRRGHGLHRQAPQRVARTVGEQDDAAHGPCVTFAAPASRRRPAKSASRSGPARPPSARAASSAGCRCSRTRC